PKGIDRRTYSRESFFKKNTRVVRDYMMIESARKEEGLSIKRACNMLGISRTGYYRKVYGLIDYQKKQKISKEIEPYKKQKIEELSLLDSEYGELRGHFPYFT
ncbi:MAG: hypothetical protein WA277_01180, partial [Nitrospirota bacterium]